MFLFYLLSTIKVKLVDEMMQSAYMCYFTCLAQKITIYRGFNLKANRWEILQYIKNSREGFHHPPCTGGGGINLRVHPRVDIVPVSYFKN